GAGGAWVSEGFAGWDEWGRRALRAVFFTRSMSARLAQGKPSSLGGSCGCAAGKNASEPGRGRLRCPSALLAGRDAGPSALQMKVYRRSFEHSPSPGPFLPYLKDIKSNGRKVMGICQIVKTITIVRPGRLRSRHPLLRRQRKEGIAGGTSTMRYFGRHRREVRLLLSRAKGFLYVLLCILLACSA